MDAKSVGLGAAGGAGVSTALFTTLKIGDLLAKTPTQSIAFPIVVFCLAALFVMGAALFTTGVSRAARPIVWAVIGVFTLVVLVGFGTIAKTELDERPVSFTANIDPTWVLGDGKAWADESTPKLRMLYRAGGADVASYLPMKSDTLFVRSRGAINLRIDGMQDLYDRYQTLIDERQQDIATRRQFCAIDPTLVCRMGVGVTTPQQLRAEP